MKNKSTAIFFWCHVFCRRKAMKYTSCLKKILHLILSDCQYTHSIGCERQEFARSESTGRDWGWQSVDKGDGREINMFMCCAYVSFSVTTLVIFITRFLSLMDTIIQWVSSAASAPSGLSWMELTAYGAKISSAGGPSITVRMWR